MVVKDSRTNWAEAFGYAEIEKKREATLNSIYKIASISKPITVTGLMTLVDRGLINLGVSVFTVLLGLSFIFYGRWVLSFYDVSFEPSAPPRLVAGSSLQPLLVGIAFVRILGAVLLGIGLLAWLTRNLSNVEAQQTIMLGLFLINVLAFLTVLLQQITLWIYFAAVEDRVRAVVGGGISDIVIGPWLCAAHQG